MGKQVLHVSLLENQLQIPILSLGSPFLDEAMGKLSWHPFNDPSLLFKETVSCRGFPGSGLCRLGSPPSPPKIANTWSSCSTLFTSELKTTATYCSQEVFPWLRWVPITPTSAIHSLPRTLQHSSISAKRKCQLYKMQHFYVNFLVHDIFIKINKDNAFCKKKRRQIKFWFKRIWLKP